MTTADAFNSLEWTPANLKSLIENPIAKEALKLVGWDLTSEQPQGGSQTNGVILHFKQGETMYALFIGYDAVSDYLYKWIANVKPEDLEYPPRSAYPAGAIGHLTTFRWPTSQEAQGQPARPILRRDPVYMDMN